MAEEVPAIADYTVIWRPGDEHEFRGDHVTAAAGKQEAIMAAAWDVWVAENPEETPAFNEVPYDLCAILEGHCKFFY